MNRRPATNGPPEVTTTTEVASSSVPDYLRSLIASCDDPPLIDELTADDLGTARATASIARAALCWLREKQDDAIAVRLRHELAEADWLTAWRLRRLSGDLSEAEDWSAIAAWTPIAELQRLRTYEPEVA
jgi:hypothetical protein